MENQILSESLCQHIDANNLLLYYILLKIIDEISVTQQFIDSNAVALVKLNAYNC